MIISKNESKIVSFMLDTLYVLVSIFVIGIAILMMNELSKYNFAVRLISTILMSAISVLSILASILFIKKTNLIFK